LPRSKIEHDDQDAISHLPSSDVSNNEKFPWLTTSEIQYLWESVANNPEQKIFYKNSLLKNTVFKFNENCYVARGKYLGSGFWGDVHLGVKYERGQMHEHGQKCIIKSVKKTNIFGMIINEIVDINKKMIIESNLSRSIYGIGDIVLMTENDMTKTNIIMPYLGDYSLAELLKKADIIKYIPMHEWLNLFVVLLAKLEKMHNTTRYIHNDIKPDNIGVSISPSSNVITFTAINFFDLGNAHKINARGFFGHPKYQPIESLTIGLLIPHIKDERVDIYALGKSFLKILKVLKRQYLYEDEIEIYRRCKKVFRLMSSFDLASRPSLQECIEKMRLIVISDFLSAYRSAKMTQASINLPSVKINQS